jgi:hypothetical protein
MTRLLQASLLLTSIVLTATALLAAGLAELVCEHAASHDGSC